jgi:hypothetical protein
MWTRLLLVALIFAPGGCTLPNQYFEDGPPSRPLTSYGVSHGLVSVPIVLATGTATGHPVWGAFATCAFFLGHETEETRNWKYFEWGKADSFADVAVPCLTGFALTKLGHRKDAPEPPSRKPPDDGS